MISSCLAPVAIEAKLPANAADVVSSRPRAVSSGIRTLVDRLHGTVVFSRNARRIGTMITTCTECQARYQLDAEKIPPRVIKLQKP